MLYDAAHSTIQYWSYASFFVMMIFFPLLIKYSKLHIKISVAVTFYPAHKGKG